MKDKVLGLLLISLGVATFLFCWEKFIEAYNFIGQPPESGRETYFAIIGQGFSYFTLSSAISIFGLSLLIGLERQKLKVACVILFVLVAMWGILEIPIYKCDFYEINHSFWDSRKGHFH